MSLQVLVEQWLAWDRNDETRKEIEALRIAGNEVELRRILGSRMAFGTAGLRARMGAGNVQMNHLTIIQTAQGYAAYLREKFPAEALATRGVALGFDGRYHSREFAQLTASVMRSNTIRTYLFDRVTPTPFIAFAVRHFHCVSGVMVTASHNPKQDNGYKVYWENGAQIISPHDKGIAAAIEANLEPKAESWQLCEGDSNPFDEINSTYFCSLSKEYAPVGHAPTDGERADLHFTYTAMHGVGAPFSLKALSLCGVPNELVHGVKEQELPDPEFPTVEFPNPEEGKSSLDLSIRTAAATGSTVILANDPDADRLAVAERNADGTWRVFNGNEIGTLLGVWAVFHARRRGDDLSRCFFLSSTVSSPVLGSIAAMEGMQFEDTLTGFKWMGSRTEELVRKGVGKVVLAFEEAIGFMWGGRVYDKDGVTAAGVMADMARYVWAVEGLTLQQKLQQAYERYGFHFSSNSYVIARDPAKVKAMFHDIATKENGGFPTTIAGANVSALRDLSTGVDTRMPDGKATLPTSKSSPIITFYLDNGITLTVRGSGTEPKLKWYTSFKTDDPNGQAVLAKFVRAAVDELVQPETYGFQRRQEDVGAAAATTV